MTGASSVLPVSANTKWPTSINTHHSTPITDSPLTLLQLCTSASREEAAILQLLSLSLATLSLNTLRNDSVGQGVGQRVGRGVGEQGSTCEAAGECACLEHYLYQLEEI